MKVGIIGLGYVGLPLSLQFSNSGVHVVGLDTDQNKVDRLLKGKSTIRHISDRCIQEAQASGNWFVSSDFSTIKELDGILICVPTPLSKNREPDLSYIFNAGTSIAQHLKKGAVVILESTTYPRTTEDDLRAVIEKGSGYRAGVDFHLAFSPEREDPGNPASEVGRIPKVVGGYTPACLEKACEIYRKAIKTVIPVSSCRTAEAVKLTENIFRSVNIALVNELKVVYAAMGVDIWEVIEAAKTKPFGYMPFYPGPGLGGHCIPIDPFYLTWKAREYGMHTRFIELAGEINTAMPQYVMGCLMGALNDQGRTLRNSRILMVGVAYKMDVDDDRESPSYALMEQCRARGAHVSYFDPHIPEIVPGHGKESWAGMKSIEWTEEALSTFDACIIVTPHKGVDYQVLLRWVPCIIDTRNIIKADADQIGKKVWKA